MTTKEQLQQQWHARIAEYRASGLTLKAWCAAHGCTVDQMKYWLYKSPKRTSSDVTSPAAPSPTARFIPMTVEDEAKSPSLVLRVGPAHIELHAGFDSRLLREVVHALVEAAPC
jgi:hypothetical protein